MGNNPSASRIQLIYSPHGPSDGAYLDETFRDVFPAFFEPKALNVMGMEQAGDVTDTQRDEIFQHVRSSRKSLLVAFHEAVGSSPIREETTLTGAYISAMYTSAATGFMMDRRNILLDLWNEENTDRRVVPFFESFPTKEEADEVGARSGDILNFSFGDESSLTLEDVLEKYPRRFPADLMERRDANWVRSISELVERNGANGKRLNFMLLMGYEHHPITGLLREQFGSQAEILEPLYIPKNALHDLSRPDVEDDEAFFRRYTFDVLYRNALGKAVHGSPYTPHASDPTSYERLKQAVFSSDFDLLVRCMGFSDTAFEDVVLPKELEGPSFVSMNDSPQTIQIDKKLIVSTLCAQLGIEKFNDPKAKLLSDAVSAIPPGTLPVYRKFCVTGDLVGIGTLMRVIASQDPDNSRYWQSDGGKGRQKKRMEHARALVTAAQRYLGQF